MEINQLKRYNFVYLSVAIKRRTLTMFVSFIRQTDKKSNQIKYIGFEIDFNRRTSNHTQYLIQINRNNHETKHKTNEKQYSL